MPSWVKDDKIWAKARKAIDKSKYDNATYWKIVTDVYKKMGGKIESYKLRLERLIESYNKAYKDAHIGDCKAVAKDLESKGVGKAIDASKFIANNKLEGQVFISPNEHWITVSGNTVYDPVYANDIFHTGTYKFNKDEYIKLLKKFKGK